MNKKLNIITFLLILILIFTIASWVKDINEARAELSDETLKEVEKLRWEHYGTYYNLKAVEAWDNIIWDDIGIEWNRDYLKIWVEDDKLFVETQDGKWFIEMEKIKEEDN